MSGTEPALTQLVGARDPATGVIELTAWTPGPAGLATLSLADGAVDISFDYASPEVLSSLVITESGPAGTALLNLVSDGHAAEILDKLTAKHRVVWQAAETELNTSTRRSINELGRLAVLLADLQEAPLGPLALGFGLVEASILTADLPTALPPELSALDLLGVGVTRIESLFRQDSGVLEKLSRLATSSLKELLEEAWSDVVAGDDLLRSRISNLIELVANRRTPRSERLGRRLLSAPLAALDVVSEARVDFDVGFNVDVIIEPVELPAVDVLQAVIAGPELSVSIAGATPDDKLWLRVFKHHHGRPPVLLSLAPFESSSFAALVAVALLPAEVDAADLRVDITVDPTQAWQPPSVRQVRAAVTTGREATRFNRRGSTALAEARWNACAERWEELDDERRAALARSYVVPRERAQHQSLPPHGEVESFTIDHLHET